MYLIRWNFSSIHFFDISLSVSGSVPQKYQYLLESIVASLKGVENIDIKKLYRKIIYLGLDCFWENVSSTKSKVMHKIERNWLCRISKKYLDLVGPGKILYNCFRAGDVDDWLDTTEASLKLNVDAD